jgi:hypothetical protein
MVSPLLPYTQIHSVLISKQRIERRRVLDECTGGSDLERRGQLEALLGRSWGALCTFRHARAGMAKTSVVTTYRTKFTLHCSYLLIFFDLKFPGASDMPRTWQPLLSEETNLNFAHPQSLSSSR